MDGIRGADARANVRRWSLAQWWERWRYGVAIVVGIGGGVVWYLIVKG